MKMKSLCNCINDSIYDYYQRDLLLALMSSLHRKYGGNRDLLPLYNRIIDEYNIDYNVRGSLAIYGYLYYLSFENSKNEITQPNSSVFIDHKFLFSIVDIDDRSYMLQVQFLGLIKMNAITSLDAKCLAFEDIKDVVKESRVNMAAHYMKYFPERYKCKQ
jgi:hypothetical protein